MEKPRSESALDTAWTIEPSLSRTNNREVVGHQGFKDRALKPRTVLEIRGQLAPMDVIDESSSIEWSTSCYRSRDCILDSEAHTTLATTWHHGLGEQDMIDMIGLL